MPSRSTETTVVFSRPFSVGAHTGRQPPGAYRVVVDEDEVQGLSFLAFHRVGTLFCTPAIGASGEQRIVSVSEAELDEAIAADRAARPTR